MLRPVNKSSAARPCPMIRGSMAHAPISHPASPTRVKRNAVLLRAVPRRRSDAMARIAPAPAHTPSIAAMIGWGQARMAFTRSPVMRVKASRPGILSSVKRADDLVNISARAKIFSRARYDHRLDIADCAIARNRSRISAYESNVSGFLRSGRSSVMQATPSRAWYL